MEIAPVLEVPRAEEGGTKQSVREHPLCDRLGDGCLSRSGEPVQPVDRRFVEVAGPKFNLVQDGASCSLETTAAIAMPILSPLCTAEPIEDSLFSCQADSYQRAIIESTKAGDVLTLVLPGEVSPLAQLEKGRLTIGFNFNP